jgi:hypothetical protein
MPANAENVMDDRRTIVRTCLAELGPSSRPGDWLKSDFNPPRFWSICLTFGADSVAVLMAVRCQLSCILLLRTAGKVAIATYSHQTVMRYFAIGCDVLQNRKKQTQNPPALAVMGVRPPSRHHLIY